MSMIALGSIKASPGVTTSALALAAAWPRTRDVIVVEADPDGGSLAPRFRLPDDLGLISLTASTRHPDHGVSVEAHTQELPGGLRVVVAPASADRAHSALTASSGNPGGMPQVLRAHADDDNTDVLIDCGRLTPRSPSLAMVERADAVVLVARPRLDEAHGLVGRVPALRAACQQLSLLTVGDRPYDPADLAAAAELELAGVLPDDRHAAAALCGRPAPARQLTRSRLFAGADSCARTLVDATTASHNQVDAVQ